MTPKSFRNWRKSLGLSQKEAAHALGLKRRVVQYYEKGERDGESISIPKYIRLACQAIAHGVEDYHGPDVVADAIAAGDTGTGASSGGVAKPVKAKKAAKGAKVTKVTKKKAAGGAGAEELAATPRGDPPTVAEDRPAARTAPPRRRKPTGTAGAKPAAVPPKRLPT